MSKRILLVLPLLGAAACSSSPTASPAAFETPAGLAVAGSAKDRLFIANADEGTLQVAQLEASFDDIEFLRGDAIQFPLRIGVGPQPRQLAATPGGEYVLVLNGVGETLRLVDANALVPAGDAEGRAIIVAAGPAGSTPAALIGAPASACTAPCLGVFYVALAAAGAVAELEVSETGGAPALAVTRNLELGGAPIGLAVHPTEPWLFVTDGADGSVARVDLATGAVIDRVPLGETPGPITVSTDGEAVVVARPRLRDVVVLQITGGAPGGLALVDADPLFTPNFACVEACDATVSSCVAPHPADAAVCATGSGLAESAAGSYTAVYLDVVPGRMVALGAPAASADSSQNLVVSCGDDSTAEYGQFVAIAQTNGPIVFLGLRRAPSDEAPAPPLAPELVTSDFCTAATLTVSEEAPPVADYLGPCLPVPARGRFACVEGEGTSATDPTSPPGVVFFPGVSGTLSGLTFDWEGVLYTSSDGGGEVTPFTPTEGSGEADFAFSDVNGRLSSIDVRPGDVLQVTTPPRTDAACAAGLGSSDPALSCVREWIIARVDDSVTPTRLILEDNGRTLAPTCYPAGGSIFYTVRAGNTHLISRSGIVERVQPGDVIGPGGTAGRTNRVLATFSPPVVERDPDACVAYDDEGQALFGAKPALYSRDAPFGFVLRENFQVLRTGYDYDQGATVSAGTLPGDMLAVSLPGTNEIAVFVSYTATNSVLGFFPFVASDFEAEDASRVLR